jgi:hypothetical protein
MRNFNTMTKTECISLIKGMFGFQDYKGMFSEKDDIRTLRSIAQAQYDKYLVIIARG